MRLVQPTDFDILAALESGGRNVAANLSIRLNQDRAYINTRLPHLLDYKLVTKIGPAENSGLYEITPRGKAALQNRDRYNNLGPNQFEQLLNR